MYSDKARQRLDSLDMTNMLFNKNLYPRVKEHLLNRWKGLFPLFKEELNTTDQYNIIYLATDFQNVHLYLAIIAHKMHPEKLLLAVTDQKDGFEFTQNKYVLSSKNFLEFTEEDHTSMIDIEFKEYKDWYIYIDWNTANILGTAGGYSHTTDLIKDRLRNAIRKGKTFKAYALMITLKKMKTQPLIIQGQGQMQAQTSSQSQQYQSDSETPLKIGETSICNFFPLSLLFR